jgi:hypothetical protein
VQQRGLLWRCGTRRDPVAAAANPTRSPPEILVAFVDEDDRAAGNDEVRLLDGVPVARRMLSDGREFDVIKAFWNPEELATTLRPLGWDVTVRRVGPGVIHGRRCRYGDVTRATAAFRATP